ncbi:MAG: hypothetical protein WD749_05160 [Phycisphaerales bacterium]
MPKPARDPARRHILFRPLWLRTFRRRHRWLFRTLVAVPLLLVGAWVLLTQSPLAGMLILPRIESALNLKVEADSVYITRSGDLVLEHARFILPNVPGPAGQVLRVGRLTADVDWRATLTGTARFHSLRIDEPLVRISQSTLDNSLNLGALDLPASSGSGALPAVTVYNAGIELGEHRGGAYTPLRHIIMNGRFGPVPGDPAGAYQFAFDESTTRVRTPGGPPEPGLSLTGKLHQDGRVEGALERFAIGDWRPETVPSTARSLYAGLDLTGEVPRTTFSYTARQGLVAELELRGVGVNIPVPQTDTLDPRLPPLMGPPATSLRMHGVNGSISFARDTVDARLTGLIEDIPYTVHLTWQGTDANSPFTCEFQTPPFRVERNPAILPYLPPRVGKILRIFSSPTALAATRLTVRRGEPVNGEAGEIFFSGEVELSEGVAAYEDFPYEFRDLHAVFRFDNERVEVVNLTGRSESGATMTAHALITPLDDTAEMTVQVDVAGAPIDERLAAALGPAERGLLGTLFSTAQHARLVEAGLIRTVADAAAEREELARLLDMLPFQSGEDEAAVRAEVQRLTDREAVPIFDMGGRVDISVHAHTPRGKGTGWRTVVDIRFPRAELLPEPFPYPVIVEDATVRIANDEGRLATGTFRGLTGGSAEVNAAFRLPDSDTPHADPDIALFAVGLPVDDLLIHAIPGDEAEEPGRPALKPLLRRLNPIGTADAFIRIAPRSPGGRMGFDTDIRLEGARLAPATDPGAQPVIIDAVSARVVATERGAETELYGQPRYAHGGNLSGPITLNVRTTHGEDRASAPAVSALATIPQLVLDSPFEALVAPFAPDGARTIEDLRRIHRPAGTLDAAVRIESPAGGAPSVAIDLSGIHRFAADLFGGRLEIPRAAGTASVRPGEGAVGFTGFGGAILYQGQPAGRAILDGRAATGAGAPEAPAPTDLCIAVRDAAFESGLLFRVIEEFLGRDTAITFGGYRPRGQFDGEIAVTAPGGPQAAPRPRITGRIVPRTLTADFAGTPIAFERMSGSLEFDPTSVKLRALTAESREWSLSGDGGLLLTPGGGYELRTLLSIRGQRLTDDLRAVLPEEVRAALAGIGLVIDGRFELRDASLNAGATAEGPWVRFDGAVAFDNASFDVGLPIRRMNGNVGLLVDRRPEAAHARWTAEVDAESFSLAGAHVRDARAVVSSGVEPGEVILRSASGECYGGRLVAEAHIFPSGPAAGDERTLAAGVRLAGVRFAPMIAALTSRPGEEGPLPPEESQAQDTSRGVLDADISLGGLLGRPETRRGRGSIRVSGGRIISVPLVVRLVEASNLMLPSNSRLDFARANFYIDGQNMNFEEVAILSTAVEIVGTGVVAWPSQAIDFSFNSKAARPIPLLSRLIQGIRDELITTRVTGVLSDPVVTLQQFPGPRRILGRLFGGPEVAQRSADFERRTEAAEARARRRADGIVPTGPRGD